MIRKQKISIAVVATAFIIATGSVETNPILTLVCLAVMAGAVYVGRLTEKEKP